MRKPLTGVYQLEFQVEILYENKTYYFYSHSFIYGL
jgi:hypothetical protein